MHPFRARPGQTIPFKIPAAIWLAFAVGAAVLISLLIVSISAQFKF
jgi:hypothetical protein